MIHRTYRSLDSPVKLVGFTLRQWTGVLAGAGLVIGLVVAAGLPAKAAISVCTLLIGVPVAVTYVSENGGLQLTTLLRDCVRWRLSAHHLAVACPPRARTPGALVEGETFAESAADAPVPLREPVEGWGV